MTMDTVLATLVARCRAFLETEWPDWHRCHGRSRPACLSTGTCVTSSLFLQQVLLENGFDAAVAHGDIPGQDVGICVHGKWHGHAWVTTDEHVIDITADQFGQPPVIITTRYDKRYRAKDNITASPQAMLDSGLFAKAALGRWKKLPTP